MTSTEPRRSLANGGQVAEAPTAPSKKWSAKGFGARDLPHEALILREATSEDEADRALFDLGADRSPWLDEVAEIVAGLASSTSASGH